MAVVVSLATTVIGGPFRWALAHEGGRTDRVLGRLFGRVQSERVLIALVIGLIVALSVLIGVPALHFTGHLSWFWTARKSDIIGGNGWQLGDLHLYLH